MDSQPPDILDRSHDGIDMGNQHPIMNTGKGNILTKNGSKYYILVSNSNKWMDTFL